MIFAPITIAVLSMFCAAHPAPEGWYFAYGVGGVFGDNALSLLLDVEDIVPGGKYSLEVSSPGLERTLREHWHYTKAVDKTIKVKTAKSYMPEEGPQTKKGVKLIKGILKQVNEDDFLLQDEKNRLYKIILSDVAKAHTVFDFDQAGKKSR